MGSSPSSSSSSSRSTGSAETLSVVRWLYPLPNNYKLVSVLGHGGFGLVLKCIKKDTKETVAVKCIENSRTSDTEVSLHRLFTQKKLDECNIVKFIESFRMGDTQTALVFELLDMTLKDFMFKQRDFSPLDLDGVRSVVQQMATALDALKTAKVIHSDIKFNNIMLVDREAQPLRLKLIDFGLAFPTCRARQGSSHQVLHFRAPEIILGLPFSEAIDMWSLGLVMAFVMLGDLLFPGRSDYDVMRCIVDLLGVPADHLLSAGMYSKRYFLQTSPGVWRLKTPQEIWTQSHTYGDYRAYFYRNLDDLETLPLKNLNMVAAHEKKDCIDLLKAMLRLDPNERITPSQVLAHPFITRGTLTQISDTSHTTTPAPSDIGKPASIDKEEPGRRDAAEPETRETEEPQPAVRLEKTVCDVSSPLSFQEEVKCQRKTCSSGSSGFYESSSPALYPGVMLVKPAPPSCCLRWYEDNGQQREIQQEDLSEERPVDKSEPCLPEDCEMEQEDTTSDDKEPEQQRLRRKKRKKNFKRFLGWMKRTFCCCVCVEESKD